jgi:hypothetical protein
VVEEFYDTQYQMLAPGEWLLVCQIKSPSLLAFVFKVQDSRSTSINCFVTRFVAASI